MSQRGDSTDGDGDEGSVLYADATPLGGPASVTADGVFDAIELHEDEMRALHQSWKDGWPTPFLWLFDREAVRELLGWSLLVALDPSRENRWRYKTEISDDSGVSRQAVTRYLEALVEVGVLEGDDGGHTRYRVDEDSEVLAALAALDRTIHEQDPDTTTTVDDRSGS